MSIQRVGAARRADYLIGSIEHAEAVAFVAAQHYARGAANTSVYRHGLFRAGALVGVTLWMPPLPPPAKSVAGENWRQVICLSRLVVADAEPKNATSLLLGASMRAVARDRRWG